MVAAEDPYQVLGVEPSATSAEIKAAYRALVKLHHPDAGGDAERILALNAAWEVLGDRQQRRRFDEGRQAPEPDQNRGGRRGPGSPHRRSVEQDGDLISWLQLVYAPIDRLLGQVINAFPAQLRYLAADPYDDDLMEGFCTFLSQSQARLEKVEQLYRSRACPGSARGFGLSLYHCLSQVQDALGELERYTMGYVDSYLHDGREMLREAKQRRSMLQQERRQLEI
jgi:molecular chaperone DnaJ